MSLVELKIALEAIDSQLDEGRKTLSYCPLKELKIKLEQQILKQSIQLAKEIE